MSIFSRHAKTSDTTTSSDAVGKADCPHGVLVPRWDSVDDMGKQDKIVHFKCESCGATFSREEGERIMAQAADHLRTAA